MIPIDKYSQLRNIAGPSLVEISEPDAFAIYQQHWGRLDLLAMTDDERNFIAYLQAT